MLIRIQASYLEDAESYILGQKVYPFYLIIKYQSWVCTLKTTHGRLCPTTVRTVVGHSTDTGSTVVDHSTRISYSTNNKYIREIDLCSPSVVYPIRALWKNVVDHANKLLRMPIWVDRCRAIFYRVLP